ncbi:MAG: hypothetical protein HRT73_12560, partial [Flavobacteriales bacterium]|nr:hypothetical protein [Flavobacteriales bacterium]
MTKRYTSLSFLFSICFLLFGKPGYTQEIITESPQLKHLTFNENDGLLIDRMNSMIFDTNNWLWLSGINSTNSDYKLRKTKINIQRFNGEAFYNVSLPEESLNNSDFVFLKKRTDNLFYVNFIKKKGEPNLYLLNPSTLDFQKIKIPKQNSLENEVVNLFPYNNYYFVFVNNKNSTSLYKLSDDLKFTYLSTFSKMKGLFRFNFKKMEDSFSVGFTHTETITINTKGILLTNRSTEEIHHSNNTVSFEDKKGNVVTQ